MAEQDSYRGRRVEDTSRQVIDIAVGVLIGLRGYSERDAFDELADGVQTLGIGVASLSRALIALAGGRCESTPYRAEAYEIWGAALTARAAFARTSTLVAVRAS